MEFPVLHPLPLAGLLCPHPGPPPQGPLRWVRCALCVCTLCVLRVCVLFWTCPLFCFVGSGVSVEFKFVSWPCDGVQRQEHRETLRGPIIVIGRKQTEVCAVFF